MSYVLIVLTIWVFYSFRVILNNNPSPFANPLLLSSILLLTVFGILDDQFEEYVKANKPLVWLLEPATVALAIPLYSHRKFLIKHLVPILISCLVGIIIGAISCILFANYIITDEVLVLSLIPKSVTSPIAMSISTQIGGMPSLTAGIVILVGIFGAVLGYHLLELIGIEDPKAQGLAIGCSAHAIGTAKSLSIGSEQGAFSTIALVLSGIITAILAPFIKIYFF